MLWELTQSLWDKKNYWPGILLSFCNKEIDKNVSIEAITGGDL